MVENNGFYSQQTKEQIESSITEMENSFTNNTNIVRVIKHYDSKGRLVGYDTVCASKNARYLKALDDLINLTKEEREKEHEEMMLANKYYARKLIVAINYLMPRGKIKSDAQKIVYSALDSFKGKNAIERAYIIKDLLEMQGLEELKAFFEIME